MHIPRRELFILAAASLGLFAAFFLLSYALAPSFAFNRWDNFEYYTPTMFETHRLWWSGVVPGWSPWQHMGEPLFANAQPGALYFPFTLIVGVFLLFSLSPQYFVLAVVVTHLPLMIFGWSVYLRSLKLERHWALAGGLAASTCGVVLCYQSFWIFTLPFLTLLPWGVLGFKWIDTRFGAWLAFAVLTLAAWLGHFQFTSYLYLIILVYAAVLARSWRRVVVVTVAATLAGMPAILTIDEIVRHTVRAANMPIETFLEAPIPVKDLLGFLFPFFDGDAVMYSGPMIYLSSAPWLLCGLLGGFVLRKNRDFLALFAAGFLFLLFSLGKNGGLLPLTFGLPVWSSFRFPHKFAPFAIPVLTVAASIGGALFEARFARSPKRFLFLGAYLVLLAVTALSFVTVDSPTSYLYIIAVTVFAAWLTFMPWRPARGLLLLSTLCAAVALEWTAQEYIPKKYQETYGGVGVRELGLTDSSRVFPVSTYATAELPEGESYMQEHSVFQSATMNHYESATGHTSPLTVTWFLSYVPSNAWGVLSPQILPAYLSSGLFPLWSIDTLVVDKQDKGAFGFLKTLPNVHAKQSLQQTSTFQMDAVQPKFYLANEVRSFERGAFLEHYARPAVPVAFVEDAKLLGVSRPGLVLDARVEPGGEMEIHTEADAPKTLVMNYTYYPQWHAEVNGEEATLRRTNGLVMSVDLPAGKNHVRLVWKSLGFKVGWLLFALGLALMVWLTGRVQKGDLRPRPL